MSDRITADEVKDVIDTNKTATEVESYITYANALVNQHLDISEHDLSDEVLKEIERYLTAHAIANTGERQAISEEAGPVSQEFSDVFDHGFYATSFGQMAVNLDSTGTLADLNDAKKSISVKAVKEEHEFRYEINSENRLNR